MLTGRCSVMNRLITLRIVLWNCFFPQYCNFGFSAFQFRIPLGNTHTMRWIGLAKFSFGVLLERLLHLFCTPFWRSVSFPMPHPDEAQMKICMFAISRIAKLPTTSYNFRHKICILASNLEECWAWSCILRVLRRKIFSTIKQIYFVKHHLSFQQVHTHFGWFRLISTDFDWF